MESRTFLSFDDILRDEPCQRVCLPGRISGEIPGLEEMVWRTATRTRDTDSSLARATMHVLAAYAEVGALDPKGLPQNAIPSFGSVCVSLCSTVVAIDELTAEVWSQRSPKTPSEPGMTEALQLSFVGDPAQGL
jgi:hypothetical protein